MIVCHCAGVTDATIARAIEEEGAVSVADVARLTGAGRRCSPCREEIANLLALGTPAAPTFSNLLEVAQPPSPSL
jgi:bacterioferritin-associated ferredoxin